MNLEDIKNEIEILTKKLLRYNELYYNENISEISDYEYDILIKKLESLEKKYPQFRQVNSPTRSIGSDINKSELEKVVHKVKMESLQNAYSFNDLFDFHRRVSEKIINAAYVVEPKVDGLSVSLEYVDGEFFRGSTRGDGYVGEDVTENLKTIISIPKKLKTKLKFLEVRAEVFMAPAKFRYFNLKEQTSNLKKAYAILLECKNNFSKKKIASFFAFLKRKPFQNPRNTASGLLKQKNVEITKQAGLDAVIFNLQRANDTKIESHLDSINFLNSIGFKTIPESQVFFNMEDCIKKIKEINTNRLNFDFEIDGAVVKLNSFEGRFKLGSTAKFPRWAIAYKYAPEEKQTTLLEIKINVSRTGVLTPVAVFRPVILSQTIVQKASLHNKNFIKNHDIRIGDEIIVRKAGEIIPEVVKSIAHKTNSELFEMPKFCPACGSKVFQNENEVAMRCVNSSCPATLVLNIVHFVSKSAMDIKGLGKSIITELVEKKLIKNTSDLFKLKFDDFLKLNRFSNKSAQNILNSIQKAKTNPLWRFLVGLGIQGVGENAAKIICKNFDNVFQIIKADVAKLTEIAGLGPIVSLNIVEFFSLKETKNLILQFQNLGLNLSSNYESKKSEKFKNLIFSVTGKLEKFTRSEFKKLIEKHSGEFSASVSKKVNILVIGKNAGSKLEKAKILNLKILNEEQFLNLI